MSKDTTDQNHRYMIDPIEEMHKSAPKPVIANNIPKTKPLDAAIQKRLDAYNALTIEEAIKLTQSRRGDSKKEIQRLEELLGKKGVTRKTPVGEARLK